VGLIPARFLSLRAFVFKVAHELDPQLSSFWDRISGWGGPSSGTTSFVAGNSGFPLRASLPSMRLLPRDRSITPSLGASLWATWFEPKPGMTTFKPASIGSHDFQPDAQDSPDCQSDGLLS